MGTVHVSMPSLTSQTSRPSDRNGAARGHRMSADIFTTAAVPGRGAALNVCVASSNAAAARGDAAQAAWGAKHNTWWASELRLQGRVCRPVVCTADDATQPSLELFSTLLTLPPAVMSNRCQQQPSNIDGRAAMRRPDQPSTSARQHWHLSGLIERTTSYWPRVPLTLLSPP